MDTVILLNSDSHYWVKITKSGLGTYATANIYKCSKDTKRGHYYDSDSDCDSDSGCDYGLKQTYKNVVTFETNSETNPNFVLLVLAPDPIPNFVYISENIIEFKIDDENLAFECDVYNDVPNPLLRGTNVYFLVYGIQCKAAPNIDYDWLYSHSRDRQCSSMDHFKVIDGHFDSLEM